MKLWLRDGKTPKNQRCIHAEGDAFAQPNQILAPRVRGRENSDDTVIKFAVERLSFFPSRLMSQGETNQLGALSIEDRRRLRAEFIMGNKKI